MNSQMRMNAYTVVQRSTFIIQHHRALVKNFRVNQHQTVSVLVLSMEDVKPIWQYSLSDT